MLPQLDPAYAVHLFHWTLVTFLLSACVMHFILVPRIAATQRRRQSDYENASISLETMRAENAAISYQIKQINDEFVYGKFHKDWEKRYFRITKDREELEQRELEIYHKIDLSATDQTEIDRIEPGVFKRLQERL